MSFQTLSFLGATVALTVGTTVTFTPNVLSSPKGALFAYRDNPLQIAQAKPERPRTRGKNTESLMEQLNLTDDQKRQIAAIRQKRQGQISQLRESMKTNQQALETLMSKNAPDQDIRTKHQQIGQNRQELSNIRFESLLEMRRVLTSSQRNQLSQLIQQRRTQSRDRGPAVEP